MVGCFSKTFAVFAIVAAVLMNVYQDKLFRFMKVNNLFKASVIVHNFRTLDGIGFESVTVSTRGTPAAALDTSGDQAELPSTFTWNGTEFQTQAWLEDHWTTGIVVLKKDTDAKARVLHERYYRGNDVNSRCVSWSMCKSVVSALLGIAVEQGLVSDIATKTVTDYVPELKGSGYDGVRIKDVLQMSSGIRFNEDYFDPFSDINMMGYTIAFGWSIDSFVKSLESEGESGKYNHYVSMDTQVLAMIITRASGRALEDFAEEFLWSKVGFESDATWVLDNAVDRTALGFGILGVTTRDWARFGWLYLNKGVSPATGEQVVAEDWVQASLTADAPHLQPGKQNTMSDFPSFGYGYQWWLCPRDDDPSVPGGDFMAVGIYGQMIYVSPADGIVIAKNAAFPDYAKLQNPDSHENLLELQGWQALRAIARGLRDA